MIDLPVLAVFLAAVSGSRSGSFSLPLNMGKLGSHYSNISMALNLLHFVQAKAAGVSQNTVNARIQALAAVPSTPALYAQTVAVAMTAASNAFDEKHAAEEPAAPVYVSAA